MAVVSVKKRVGHMPICVEEGRTKLLSNWGRLVSCVLTFVAGMDLWGEDCIDEVEQSEESKSHEVEHSLISKAISQLNNDL